MSRAMYCDEEAVTLPPVECPSPEVRLPANDTRIREVDALESDDMNAGHWLSLYYHLKQRELDEQSVKINSRGAVTSAGFPDSGVRRRKSR